jgi:hypothetical protein
MGLKLRYHLFHGVEPGEVYNAYAEFYAAAGHPLRFVAKPTNEDSWYLVEIHEPNGGWTILHSHGGWEWEVRRQAQFYASRALHASGLLVWVYDGDYWLYELFANGKALDQFVQSPDHDAEWFPGKDCSGNPQLLAAQFPWLKIEDIVGYLVRPPVIRDEDGDLVVDWDERAKLDVPVRAGDQYRRFEECAVLDFLRLLGVRVELRGPKGKGIVTLESPLWGTFRITGDPWLASRDLVC